LVFGVLNLIFSITGEAGERLHIYDFAISVAVIAAVIVVARKFGRRKTAG
jgi:hypothetical protein